MPPESELARLTPRQSARRQSILAAVREQLSRFGYEGVNMRGVADSAGVSPTTLYNLYDSKDSLVLAALEEHLGNLARQMDQNPVGGLARLELRARISAEGIMGAPRYAEAMIRVMFNADAQAPISIYLLDSMAAGLEEDIREMQALGEVRPGVDAPQLARSIMANNWTTLLMWAKGYIALLDLPEELIRSHLGTILPALTDSAWEVWEDRIAQ